MLRQSGEPMSARRIYEAIIEQDLFRFGAKEPLAILSATLRPRVDSSILPRPPLLQCCLRRDAQGMRRPLYAQGKLAFRVLPNGYPGSC